jgi:hypothetical protein
VFESPTHTLNMVVSEGSEGSRVLHTLSPWRSLMFGGFESLTHTLNMVVSEGSEGSRVLHTLSTFGGDFNNSFKEQQVLNLLVQWLRVWQRSCDFP